MVDHSVDTAGSRAHLPGLQSLRGIASIIVVFQHCTFYFSTTPDFRFVSELIFNSHAAVVLFFVLSGFVLVRSLVRPPLNSRSIAIFYLRRIFRIYPVLWVAVTLAGLVIFTVKYLPVVPQTSLWFKSIFVANPSLLDFAKAASGTGTNVLPPLWTIRIEVIASLMIPILAWLTAGGRLPITATAIFLIAITPAIALLHHQSINYLVDFAIGAAIASWTSTFRAFNSGRMDLYMLSASVLVLVFFRIIDSDWRFEAGYTGVTPDLIEALAAGALILISASKPESVTYLHSRVLIFIGDISYSVYLLHFPLLVLIAKLLGRFLPDFIELHQDVSAILLSAATLISTISISTLTYRHVELPGIEFSKKIIKVLDMRYFGKH